MKSCILSVGYSKSSSIECLVSQPEFRRASRNSMMAYLAVEQALLPIKDNWEALKSRSGLVLGTGHGELATTVDFLKELKKSGVPRPLLFQNSLHHSTAGFLTKVFGITGLGLTTSQRFFSGEGALELASDVIETGCVDLCVAVGVDALSSFLQTELQGVFPENYIQAEGAGAVVLASDELISRLGVTPMVNDLKIRCFRTGEIRQWDKGEAYESDGIEKLAKRLEEKRDGGVLELVKPNGSFSRIEWRVPC